MAEEYDVVMLGSGPADKYRVWTLASQGKEAAVLDRRYVGGSCPNIACLRSKSVIHSAKVAPTFAAAWSLAAPRTAGGSTWPPDVAGSAGWCRGWSKRTSASTGRAGAEFVMGSEKPQGA